MLFSEMQPLPRILLALALAAAIALGSTPFVMRFARRVGAMDIPDHKRHIHTHPIPRMGGMAIFLGFLFSVLLFIPVTRSIQGILIGTVIIVATGVVDDIISLKYYIKFGLQILAAAVAVYHGVVIEGLMNPLVFSNDDMLFMGFLRVPVTILWIVGITNAVNLIDGLDGLACGVSAISSLTMLVVAMLVAELDVALMLSALAGACLGFLPYNFNPAKIFMGDTGALLLGYVLATVSIVGLFKFYAIITFIVPILALALPLFDTLFAIFRRLLRGQNPMTPDRGHLHHRLIDHGLSQKQATAVLYSLSAMLGLTAVVITTTGRLRLLLLIVDILFATGAGFFTYYVIEHPARDATIFHGSDEADGASGEAAEDGDGGALSDQGDKEE